MYTLVVKNKNYIHSYPVDTAKQAKEFLLNHSWEDFNILENNQTCNAMLFELCAIA